MVHISFDEVRYDRDETDSEQFDVKVVGL